MKSFFFLLFTGLSFNSYSQCHALASRMNVGNVDTANTHDRYSVELEVMILDSMGCNLFNNGADYEIWDGCGFYTKRILTVVDSTIQDSMSNECLQPFRYSGSRIKTYTLRDTVDLDSASCVSLTFYYRGTHSQFANLDSGAADISWVQINSTYLKDLALFHKDFKVVEAIKGNHRFFRTAFKRSRYDSLYQYSTYMHRYDSLATGYKRRRVQFKPPHSVQRPLPAYDYSQHDDHFSFTPHDTGFFALPIQVEEWNPGLPWNTFLAASTSHFSVPYFIGDNPLHSNFTVFPDDTLELNCGDNLYRIPFTTNILRQSISTDGTDLKFENSLGHPVYIKEVMPFKDSLHVRSTAIDARFFFDGLYSLRLVKGTDQNTVFNKCGYQLSPSDTLYLRLRGCPNYVDLSLEETAPLMEVYPNPFQDELVLETKPETLEEIRMSDLRGATVEVKLKLAEDRVRLQTEAGSGLYLLHLRFHDGTSQVIKVLKN